MGPPPCDPSGSCTTMLSGGIWEEQADVGGLLTTQGQGDVWTWADDKAIPRSLALVWPGSTLRSIAPATIEGHATARGLGSCLGPYQSLKTMNLLDPF